jgi:hypothetical protein
VELWPLVEKEALTGVLTRAGMENLGTNTRQTPTKQIHSTTIKVGLINAAIVSPFPEIIGENRDHVYCLGY